MRRNPLQIRFLLFVFFLLYSFCGYGQVVCVGHVGVSSDTPCVGGVLHLYAHDTGLSTNTTYSWNGPNNFSSNLKNPSINNFTSAGVGTYTLTASDTCTFVVAEGVVLNTTPNPIVSPAGPIWGCVGDSVPLITNYYYGNAYQWYFNSIPIPGATLNRYTIGVLSASDTGWYHVFRITTGCLWPSDSVLVTLTPSISITPLGPTSFCAGGSVILQANVPCCNVSAQWQKNGADIPGATASSYVATTTGNYTIKITRANCSGSITSAAVSVTAYPLPTPGISPAGPISICQGGSVVLSATNVSGFNNYSWYANGNLYPVFSDTCSISNAGIYWVKVTDNHGCAGNSPSVTVNVLPTPTVPVISQGSLVWACPYSSVTLSTNYVAGNSYEWYFNSIPIPGFMGTSYVFPSITSFDTGLWKVSVFALNGCSATSAPTRLSLYPEAVIVSSGADTFCAGDSVRLSANITCCSVSYQWQEAPSQYGNYTNIAGANNINYTAHDSAFYQVVVTSSLCGTTTSAPLKVTVNPWPNPVLTPSGRSSFCPGSGVMLHESNHTGIYEWYRNGTIFSPAPASIDSMMVTSPGVYSVRVWNWNALACAVFSANDTVSFLPTPSVSISPNQTYGLAPGHLAFYPGLPDTLIVSASGFSSYTYQWYYNGVAVPGYSDSWVADTIGAFKVKVTGSNGCAIETSVSIDTLQPCGTAGMPIVTSYLNPPFCIGSTQIVKATVSAQSGLVIHWQQSPTPFLVNGVTYPSFGPNYVTTVGNTITLTLPNPLTVPFDEHIFVIDSCLNVNPQYYWQTNHTPVMTIHYTDLNLAYVISAGMDTLCEKDSLIMQSQNTNPAYAYQWQRNGTDISGASDSFYVAKSSGNYSIKIHYSGCVDSAKDTVGLTIKPVPGKPVIASDNPVCISDSLNLAGIDTSAGVSYQWSGPNGFSDTVQNTGIGNAQVTDSGEYILTVTKDGCSSKDSIDVVVKQRPAVPNGNSNGSICAGDTLLLQASDSSAGVSYEWSGGNNFSDTLQTTYIVNAQHADSGLYMVRALLNGCYSTYDTINAVVNDWVMPAVSISSNPSPVAAGQTAVFTASAVNGGPSPSYQWYLNSVIIPGAIDSVYTGVLNAGDWIAVTMHSDAPCAYAVNVLSNDIFATSFLNVGNVGNVENVIVWPNPATRILNIECGEKVNVELKSIEGRVLLREEDAKRIDISGLADGVYMLQVYDERGVLLKVEKVVKE